jgi:hypothetical protein
MLDLVWSWVVGLLMFKPSVPPRTAERITRGEDHRLSKGAGNEEALSHSVSIMVTRRAVLCPRQYTT